MTKHVFRFNHLQTFCPSFSYVFNMKPTVLFTIIITIIIIINIGEL